MESGRLPHCIVGELPHWKVGELPHWKVGDYLFGKGEGEVTSLDIVSWEGGRGGGGVTVFLWKGAYLFGKHLKKIIKKIGLTAILKVWSWKI